MAGDNMAANSDEFIDFVALRKHVANYDTLFQTLLELFLDQAPLWIEELHETFATRDAIQIRQLCHKIKGGASTLLARRIVESAAELSSHARSGDLTQAEESVNRLISAIDGTANFIRASGEMNS